LEETREALGYARINLYSLSYGTRVAYIYGLRHPDSLHHSLMYAVNPPGGFVWEAEMVDRQLHKYAALWADDPESVRRTPDLIVNGGGRIPIVAV
jgi:pimeloyl-ACP methyl ester carboxylesterase